MDNKNLCILVISDLHAIVDKNQDTDSYLHFDNGTSKFGDSIIEYLQKLNKKFDVLICSGDISNKADASCFDAGWNFVNTLKNKLSIPNALCVPGNHDHNSRSNNDFSPKHQIQYTSPSFPFNCHDKNTHFWAWNWVYSNEPKFNAILLNTSAYHGYGDEYKHGRIAIEASDQIFNFLNSNNLPKKHFNLLLCHHHPEEMEQVDRNYDGEQMIGGQYLLSKIQEADVGPWLIIHGHKHFANISYASSSSGAPPTILSAGSLSAKLYPSIEDRTSNQFYILNIALEQTEIADRMIGTFEAYEWKIISGWGPSSSSNLPAKGGFGSIKTPAEVAREIAERISEETPFLESHELEFIDELITNFTPSEFKSLIKKLEKLKLQVQIDKNKIIEIGVTYD